MADLIIHRAPVIDQQRRAPSRLGKALVRSSICSPAFIRSISSLR